MRNPIFLLALLLAATLACGRDKQPDWVQVRSQHFTVVCNGNAKQAQHLADQFERMRLVFHTAFPHLSLDPAAPIVVIAVKDPQTFRALEPSAYLAKGRLEIAGLFLRAPDKNYVLLRMDASGDHPYATVYHEYTHLLLSKMEWLPLWLNEGFAEFYQNTEIHDKYTVLGQPSAGELLFLRQSRLLPLATLFTVDQNSPYYHEEDKGSTFYSESWALTHYLQLQDFKQRTHKLDDYMLLVSSRVDPVTAASRAFGDLKRLQSDLEHYIEQSAFAAVKLNTVLPAQDASFQTQPLTDTQAAAIRADFLAYNQRESDARALLDQVLRDDPNNTLAHETMGFLEFRAGHLEQAERWYDQAVKLDSQSYLANYYFSAIAMNLGQSDPGLDARIESSLQKSIKLNPSFAPAYDRLAMFYGMRRQNLDQAHILNAQAVQLDPGNIGYRVNAANVLDVMQRDADALAVLKAALPLAKTPGDIMEVQNALAAVQQEQSARQQNLDAARRFREASASEAQDAQPALPPPLPPLTGPHRTLAGTLLHVHCSAPASMDLDLQSAGKTIALHAANYYKIRFTAMGFTPTGELHPCTDLEGRHASVEYVVSASPKLNGVVAVELYK